jgi:hypothetical protein
MFMTRECAIPGTCMNLCSSVRVAAMEARRADKDCTAGVFCERGDRDEIDFDRLIFRVHDETTISARQKWRPLRGDQPGNTI